MLLHLPSHTPNTKYQVSLLLCLKIEEQLGLKSLAQEPSGVMLQVGLEPMTCWSKKVSYPLGHHHI